MPFSLPTAPVPTAARSVWSSWRLRWRTGFVRRPDLTTAFACLTYFMNRKARDNPRACPQHHENVATKASAAFIGIKQWTKLWIPAIVLLAAGYAADGQLSNPDPAVQGCAMLRRISEYSAHCQAVAIELLNATNTKTNASFSAQNIDNSQSRGHFIPQDPFPSTLAATPAVDPTTILYTNHFPLQCFLCSTFTTSLDFSLTVDV